MSEDRKHYHRGRRKSSKPAKKMQEREREAGRRKQVDTAPKERQLTPEEKEWSLSEGPNAAKSVGRSENVKKRKGKGRRYRDERDKKEKKKGIDIISTVILIAAVVVFCVAAFQLFKIGKGYLDGRSEYKEIEKLAITTSGKGEEETFKVNFDELKKINSDTIGWIRFTPEPSIINYPIVQGEDNQKYLHTTFSANENTLGAIFLNVDNNAEFTDKNSIVYGHRMKDGSMFRHLQDYEEKSFWEANPYFYIYTPDGREIKYHIYSAGQVLDTADVYLTTFGSDETFQSYIDMTKKASIYDTGVEVTVQDTVVTLSTCTSASDEHRFVVIGVKESERRVEE